MSLSVSQKSLEPDIYTSHMWDLRGMIRLAGWTLRQGKRKSRPRNMAYSTRWERLILRVFI